MGDEASSSLAPGFRFHPTDEELVSYYLKRKVCGKPFRFDAISEIDIYRSEPWDLPGQSRLKSRDLEWYFFSALDKKYGNGWRTNRATDQGYWKTTGKDRSVRRFDRTVGMKKTLVFHIGRAPRGERTNWVMHEYKLVDEELGKAGIAQDAFVLCRVFQKSGTGPKNGEQYGAPFVEEDWDDNVLVPKREVGVDGYCEIRDEDEYVQQQNDVELEQNLVMQVPPVNELQVISDGGDDYNYLGDSGGFLEDDQKLFIGTGESDDMPELPDEQNFFDSPEHFQMDLAPVKNEFFEPDDLLNLLDADHNTDDPVDSMPTYFDDAPPHDPPVVNESFLEIDDLNPVNADPSGFEMLDEYLQYFDATDNNFNQSPFTEEVGGGNGELFLVSPEFSKTPGNKGASSSKQEPEITKVAPDGQYNEGWDDTVAKQVSRMLGSISAPPAFAAEFPTKEATFGQNSTAQSSSSIHVTAGMIRISGMTVSGTEKIWSFAKSEDTDFILPYGSTMGDLMTVERLISNSVLSSKGGSVMAHCWFYFIFLWILVLSVSYKIGSYIYTW